MAGRSAVVFLTDLQAVVLSVSTLTHLEGNDSWSK
jgi:hypothetical protein